MFEYWVSINTNALGRNPFWRLMELLAENNHYESVNNCRTARENTVRDQCFGRFFHRVAMSVCVFACLSLFM